MRGLDPATGAVKSEPWTRSRVERFVSERREVGPIAEVVRPGVERTVQSQVERSTVVAQSTVPIRYGHAQQQLSQQDATILARTVAQNLGLGLRPDLRLSPAQSDTVDDALARVGLQGLGPRRPAQLSGGQASRAA